MHGSMRVRRSISCQSTFPATSLRTCFLSHSSRSRRAARGSTVRDEEDESEAVRRRQTQNGIHGRIHLHKSRGQHILTNPRVLDGIIRKAYIRPTDTVLEIGPGTGNLTLKLLEAAERVVAIEIDARMIEILNERASESDLGDRLTVIRGDAVKVQFPEFDLCVANIPYGISSPLVLKLLYGGYKFRNANLLLQKEFARRIMANPGDSEFNRLAVNVKLVATVEFLMNVSKKDFVPCPKVDSSLIRIQPRTKIPAVDLNEWHAFIRTCFGKKNKTLGAIFKQKKKVLELRRWSEEGPADSDRPRETYSLNAFDDEDSDVVEKEMEENDDGDVSESGLFKEKILSVLKSGGYEEKRPSKLSVEELLCLLSIFNQAGIYFHPR